MTKTPHSALKVGHKFSLTTVVVTVLAMSVFWLVTTYNTENILRQQANSLGDTLARQTAILVTELVLSNDLISMNVLLNQLTRDAAISQAAVLSVDDQVIAIAGSSVSSSNTDNHQFFGSYISPIALQGSIAGYVRINLDQTYIEKGVTRNFIFILIALSLLIIVAITVTMALTQHFITLPLRTLAGRIQQLQHGEIELSPFAERNDEVGLVIQTYNRLAYSLERGAHGRLSLPEESKQLSAQQDEFPIPDSAGVITGSVLQIRISNYQSLLHGSNRSEGVKHLNTCYFTITQVVELYNGNVEHCAEEAIVISFGARQIDDEHAFHACCSALLFLSLMQRLPELKLQCGLHCGELLTGVFSPLGRNRYTIAGDSIDVARRICDSATADHLVISEQALQQAGGDTHLICEQYSEFFDPGLDQLICTWLVKEPDADLKALLDSQAEHLLSLGNPV